MRIPWTQVLMASHVPTQVLMVSHVPEYRHVVTGQRNDVVPKNMSKSSACHSVRHMRPLDSGVSVESGNLTLHDTMT